MNVGELYEQFRGDVYDIAKPYLWSDWEIYGYMDDAYRMFVRLTGGIADFTSPLTQIDIVAGEAIASLDKRVLRITGARRASDGRTIDVINHTDLVTTRDTDYGSGKYIYEDDTPGEVKYMVIGEQRGKVRWVQIPQADNVAKLHIYRLPLVRIDREKPDKDFEFDEIGDEHITHLSLWMQHRAYMKADADTFDKGKSDDLKLQFEAYCNFAKSEWERYKSKPREVVYGGL